MGLFKRIIWASTISGLLFTAILILGAENIFFFDKGFYSGMGFFVLCLYTLDYLNYWMPN